MVRENLIKKFSLTFIGFKSILFKLDLCASFFKLFLDLFCVSFGDALFNRLRSAVNQCLCVFQAQTGDVFHQFDNAHLACASLSEDNVEFGFLFFSRERAAQPAITTGAAQETPNSSSIAFIQLVQFKNGQCFDVINKLCDFFRSHDNNLPFNLILTLCGFFLLCNFVKRNSHTADVAGKHAQELCNQLILDGSLPTSATFAASRTSPSIKPALIVKQFLSESHILQQLSPEQPDRTRKVQERLCLRAKE